MAIDRKTMSETLYAGMGHGTFRYQRGHLGYDDPPTVEEMADYSPWLRFDPDRARALLTEAGYPNGFELEYLLSAAPSSQDIIVQQALEQVGVKVVFKQVESVVATQSRINRTFKHMTSWASVTSFEPSGPARAFWLSDSPNNFGGINDPVITDLVEKVTYTLDPDEQERLIQQLNERDVDQQYHLLLPPQMQTFIWQPWLHNVVNAPSGNYQVFSHYQYENVWVDDTAPAERRGRKA